MTIMEEGIFKLDVVDNVLMMCPLPPPPGQSYHSLEGRLKLVIQPQSQRLHVGENLQLMCGAVGRPIPRYQWHRNGVPIPNATKRKLMVRTRCWRAEILVWKLFLCLQLLNWQLFGYIRVYEIVNSLDCLPILHLTFFQGTRLNKKCLCISDSSCDAGSARQVSL